MSGKRARLKPTRDRHSYAVQCGWCGQYLCGVERPWLACEQCSGTVISRDGRCRDCEHPNDVNNPWGEPLFDQPWTLVIGHGWEYEPGEPGWWKPTRYHRSKRSAVKRSLDNSWTRRSDSRRKGDRRRLRDGRFSRRPMHIRDRDAALRLENEMHKQRADDPRYHLPTRIQCSDCSGFSWVEPLEDDG
jgi:hypothetical protein